MTDRAAGRGDGTLLTILLTDSRDTADKGAAAARRAAGQAGIDAEVVVAPPGATWRDRIERGLAGVHGDYVLLADGAALEAAAVAAMWDARSRAGLVLGAPSEMVPTSSRLVWNLTRRALSLPVLPDARFVLFRRDALPSRPAASDRFEWIVEAIVLVNADGWPVVRVSTATITRPAAARMRAGTLYRLWVLRNSAFSADYDERAYNSVIPLQRYWQRARYRIITGFVDRKSRILDIGCGSSRIVQALPRAVGLDIQLKKLRRIAGSTPALVQATITRLPFRDASFDTLICSQVIEHVSEPLVDWREFNRVLAPGGTFVVGTPDYATFTWPALERAYAIVHPRGYVNEHINRYTAASLRACLEQHGFTITDTAYVGGGELIYRARKISL